MSETTPASGPGESAEATETHSRRGFFEVATAAIGLLIGIVPLVIGVFTFLDPLRRKRRVPGAYQGASGGKEGYVRLTSLEGLPVGQAPQRFPVIANKRDAWNFLPDQPVGAVYVERTGEKEVRVFNATCPHAGCSVASNGEEFHCPCHNSSFNRDGTKRASETGRENPSPRNMDSLEYEIIDGELWVDFKNFYTGIEEKVAKQ